MTHEQTQLALMREVLQYVPPAHQREAGDAMLKLIRDVWQEARETQRAAIKATPA